MKSLTLRVNSLLKRFFELNGFMLVDFKLEFGHDENNHLLVGDELNRNSMRIREVGTLRCFDKNIYRTGSTLEKVIETCQLLSGSRNGLKVDQLK
jgi:phosphoribosylaminoimidazole-succinocarboxamide synthase